MTRVSNKQIIINLRAEVEKLKAEQKEVIKKAVHVVKMEERLKCRKLVTKTRNESKKAAKREMRPLINVSRKTAKNMVESNVKKRVVTIVKNTVDRIKLRAGLVYMDGVLCFPVLLNFGRANNIAPTELGILILICVLKEGRCVDLDKYGFQKNATHQHLTALSQKGLLEKFGDDFPIYTPSMKGRRLFLDFKLFYRDVLTNNLHNAKGRIKRNKWPK
jgi:hypothetical protein